MHEPNCVNISTLPHLEEARLSVLAAGRWQSLLYQYRAVLYEYGTTAELSAQFVSLFSRNKCSLK